MDLSIRSRQAARMLGLSYIPADAPTAAAAITAQPDAFAAALVAEAAANDDITSRSDAEAYIRERVEWFGELLHDPAAILELVNARLARWESSDKE